MERIPVSENFYLDELVDPITYVTEKDHGLSKIKPQIIDCLQLLRSLYRKPITVNNWWYHKPEDLNINNVFKFSKLIDMTRGLYQWSGFRSKLSKIGAKSSKHKKGEAVDPKGNQNLFYRIVKKNALLFYKTGLRRLEDPNITNGWLHMDISNSKHVKNRIRIVDRIKHVDDIIVSYE